MDVGLLAVERTGGHVPARVVLHPAVRARSPLHGDRADLVPEPVGADRLLEPVERGDQVRRAGLRRGELGRPVPHRDGRPGGGRAERQLGVIVDAPRELVRRCLGDRRRVDRRLARRNAGHRERHREPVARLAMAGKQVAAEVRPQERVPGGRGAREAGVGLVVERDVDRDRRIGGREREIDRLRGRVRLVRELGAILLQRIEREVSDLERRARIGARLERDPRGRRERRDIERERGVGDPATRVRRGRERGHRRVGFHGGPAARGDEQHHRRGAHQ